MLRALCHILRSETKDAVAFNRVKVIFDPKGGASGMQHASGDRLRKTLILSGCKGDGRRQEGWRRSHVRPSYLKSEPLFQVLA